MPSVERRTSAPAVGAGILIALALPILYFLAAALIWHGVADLDEMADVRSAINSLSLNAAAGLFFAVVGLVMIQRAADLGTAASLTLFVIGLPVVAVLWFLSYATLGGALGSPF
jgi:hypothetical protein